MAWCIDVYDKNLFDWKFAGQPTGQPILKTVKEWNASEKATITYNLAEFNMTGQYAGLSCCEVIAQGRRVSWGYEKFTDLLYINDNNACRGYSKGIENGIVKLNRPKGGNRTRNGVGMTTSGDLIVAQTTHKTTDTALCNMVNTYVKAMGKSVKTFILEDGGGSTAKRSSAANLTIAPEGGRPCATALCVWPKSPITITHPIYNKCPNDISTKYVQMFLTGLEVDGDAQTLTKNRILAAAKALGLPAGMQTGTADYYMLKKMGFKIGY